jgi:prepilin-type N-terminal cleavage/methylation domain-containing protein
MKEAGLKIKGKKKESHGFTLVELIVSVGVFSIVMLVAVGALLSLLAANQRAQTLKVVMNNLNLAMENMVKDIRVGTDYITTGNSFTFQASNGTEIIFRLNGDAIERSVGGSDFVSIVSDDVEVEQLQFIVFGAEAGDGRQPRVNILMAGQAGVDDDTQTSFNLQTTATQRLIDS